MLERGDWDGALGYFTGCDDFDSAVAHYGRATARVRKHPTGLTPKEYGDIAEGYQTALKKEPEFADALLMRGDALLRQAGSSLEEHERHPSGDVVQQLSEISTLLEEGKDSIKSACQLNTVFNAAATLLLQRYSIVQECVKRLAEKDRISKARLN